jgi:hypothetical protein
VLPKILYDIQRLATAATRHYLHGTLYDGSANSWAWESGGDLPPLSAMVSVIPHWLITAYRQATGKHADETGWHNNWESAAA